MTVDLVPFSKADAERLMRRWRRLEREKTRPEASARYVFKHMRRTWAWQLRKSPRRVNGRVRSKRARSRKSPSTPAAFYHGMLKPIMRRVYDRLVLDGLVVVNPNPGAEPL